MTITNLTAAVEGLREIVGAVTWHSSEEDGGPDVGISVALPGGKTLWVGELLASECPLGVGYHGVAVWDDRGKHVIGTIGDAFDVVRDMVELHIAPALRNTALPIIDAQAARIAELEAEVARLRERLEHIAFISCNGGGWFEQDAWAAYCELGDIARAALGGNHE